MIDTLKIGDVLLDNDPRQEGRTIVVEAIAHRVGKRVQYAVYQAGVRRAYIRFDRIFADGKKRRFGWTLLPGGG